MASVLIFQELVTVKDEELDLAQEEMEALNSAHKYMGMEMEQDGCGSLVFWGKKFVLSKKKKRWGSG